MTNVLRPGDFKKLGSLTIRVRERLPGGVLTGIFIDDQRNPAERINIIAEQGVVQKNERGSILVLQTGNFQRIELGKRDPSIVEFKSYAFDLSQFSRPPEKITLGARERFFEELISPSSEDSFEKQSPGVLRIELHDRLLSVFYPFAFVILAFAVLAPPRTTREGRSFAICVLVLAVLVIRMGGFGLSAVSAANPSAVFIQYLLLAAATSVGLLMIVRGVTIDTPTAIAGVLSRFRS